MNSLSFLGFAGLFAAACSAPAVETDEVMSSDSDLSATGIGEACSAPIRSADGAWAAIDLCPSNGAAGQLVRIDLATNASTVIATYPATDRLENLSEQGGTIVFDVLHEVDAAGAATRGIDVHVHDWSLASARTITTAALAGVAGDFHKLAVLGLTEDGKNVFYAASAAQAGDEEIGRRLLVAPSTGADAPAAVDLGEGVRSDDLKFSTSGDSIVAHEVALDANGAVGEKLHLVESRGAAGPRQVGSPRAAFASTVMGNAKGKKNGKAWDGTRAWGLRENANETNDLVTFDPRTGTETILESALGLRIISSVGADVVYTTTEDVAAGSDVTLKRIPVAGGTPTILAKTTVPTRDHAKVAFDLIAAGPSGNYGVFKTISGATVSTWSPFERWLVKLDGSAPAEKLPGTGSSFMDGESALGDSFLFLVAHSNGQYGRRVVDLKNGTVESGGIMLGYADSILVGDGSFLELESCFGGGGGGFGDTWRQIRHVTHDGETVGPCGRNNWSTSHLAIAGSPVVVFFSEQPVAVGNRYPVAIVRP